MSKISPIIDHDFQVKEELYSLFYEITCQIKGRELKINEEDYRNNIQSTKLTQIVSYLKDSVRLLMIQRIDLSKSNDTSLNSHRNNNYVEEYEYMLQSYERNERNHLQWFYEMIQQKEAYKSTIDEYIQMEKDFEELKTKVKYENGRFLENDRKDNEILILRAENVNIKQAINELELTKHYFQAELLQKDEQIERCQKLINELCSKLEVSQKELTMLSKSNLPNNERNYSNLFCKLNPIGKCVFCGSSMNTQQKINIATTDQTNIHSYNNKKFNQKAKKTFVYKPAFINESFITTIATNETKDNANNNNCKPSIQGYFTKAKIEKHKHNGSMNMILENTHENIYSRFTKHKRCMKNYSNSNIKVTKTPLNQTQCSSIHNYYNSHLSSKRGYISPRTLLCKQPLKIIKSNSSLNYASTKIDQM